MTLQVGMEIGPYQITDQIGAGGMATIYKAYQPKLDRHVAIKVMHESFAHDQDFRSRFHPSGTFSWISISIIIFHDENARRYAQAMETIMGRIHCGSPVLLSEIILPA